VIEPGAAIELRPVTVAVAQAVLAGVPLEFVHAPDWPHADTLDALRPLAEHPEDTGPGTFFVVEDGVVVGDCGWFGPPDQAGEVEIGYGLAPSARGRGLGSRAVQELVAWVRTQGATSVRAEVLPGNEASLRLLRGIGFVVDGEHAGHVVMRG
jgi:RimJ/RimL family protein N-acetyltransferase